MNTDERDKASRRIALAMGWKYFPNIDEPWTSPQIYNCSFTHREPPFTTDANAALEAAREIVGESDLECHGDVYVAICSRPNDMGRIECTADTAPLALVAMCVAILDGRISDAK